MELKQIASFSVNHKTLERGIYTSRIDGDITTYDIRVKLPNSGDYLKTPAMHRPSILSQRMCAAAVTATE